MQMKYWIYGKEPITALYPWKLHVYGLGADDYLEIMDVVSCLKLNKWQYKVLNPALCNLGYTLGSNQTGKMLTIYPRSKQEFTDIIFCIDELLTPYKGVHIQGDKKFDSPSGRIFYRYELKDRTLKDYIFDLGDDKNADYELYANNYEPNRGWDNYMSIDMTSKDDPFFGLKLGESGYEQH